MHCMSHGATLKCVKDRSENLHHGGAPRMDIAMSGSHPGPTSDLRALLEEAKTVGDAVP